MHQPKHTLVKLHLFGVKKKKSLSLYADTVEETVRRSRQKKKCKESIILIFFPMTKVHFPTSGSKMTSCLKNAIYFIRLLNNCMCTIIHYVYMVMTSLELKCSLVGFSVWMLIYFVNFLFGCLLLSWGGLAFRNVSSKYSTVQKF